VYELYCWMAMFTVLSTLPPFCSALYLIKLRVNVSENKPDNPLRLKSPGHLEFHAV